MESQSLVRGGGWLAGGAAWCAEVSGREQTE
ncbi:hypothetical protein Pmani_020725, partial [Petrolisthes manimaculis]